MKTPIPVAEITGTGRFLPGNVVTNLDLERSLDTSDEWIPAHTEDSDAGSHQTVCILSSWRGSGTWCIRGSGVKPGDVDILIVSTATPDRWLPSTACDVQAILGCSKAVAFDVMFLYGSPLCFEHGRGYIAAGRARVALVWLGKNERDCRLNGSENRGAVRDGGGAAVLQPSNGSRTRGILSSHLQSDGNLANLLYRPGGGSRGPSAEHVR